VKESCIALTEPFEAAVVACRRQPREVLQQRLADALAALLRLDEEVLEIEARPGEEGREVGEEERERDDAAGALGDHGLDHGLGAEQMQRELVGRDLEQMRQALEFGKAADQDDDGIDVARLGGAQGEGGRSRHAAILPADDPPFTGSDAVIAIVLEWLRLRPGARCRQRAPGWRSER
jgi:hypothetical protein